MRLAVFETEGRRSFGIVEGDDVMDFGNGSGSSFADLLMHGGGSLPADARRLPLALVTLLPPLADPANKVLALGWSYRSHQEETGHKADPFPFFFLKHAQSLVGNRQPIMRPSVSDAFDFEGEFAVVIGKPGRHIPESEAMAHVAGYSVLMDGSVRDWQKQSVTAGKNFDRSSSFGPWIVTADEIADPHALQLTTRLNGAVMQDTSTGQLAWPVAYLVHYCSTFTELRTGDVISTGTPGGVGHKRTPQIWLKPGDRLEVEVSGIGVLSNDVEQE